jgi:putative MATE family efflux protein
MKDLTSGSIARDIVGTAVPIGASLFLQALHLLIDLYFVATLGEAAVAGVGAAGTLVFALTALTQVLGAGVLSLTAQAVGAKESRIANLVFNQSLTIALACIAVTLLGGYAFYQAYIGAIAGSPEAQEEGSRYLFWSLPGFALGFVQTAMTAALRATGNVKPALLSQTLTTGLKCLLSPILISGWGTDLPLGVSGAGIASSASIACGVIVLAGYFTHRKRFLSFSYSQCRPRIDIWKRMLAIGLPSGGEYALMFVYTATTYWVISDFGATAQAGFGIGSRIVVSFLFIPGAAIAFATAPIAGQTLGAGNLGRVRETFKVAAVLNVSVMTVVALLMAWHPQLLVRVFANEPEVERHAVTFLQTMSLVLVAQGLIFTCSGLFQGLGNTIPALASSLCRTIVFIPIATWLSTRPTFHLEQIWQLAVATAWLQALIACCLLWREFRRRLGHAPPRALARDEAQGGCKERGALPLGGPPQGTK